jgi:SAM-dependent methyltransferase
MTAVPTSSDPHGHHDWHSSAYVDGWIARDAEHPERAGMLRDVAARIPFDDVDAVHVLDVGGGYGALATAVLERFANGHVVLHDFSEPMLAQAAERLSRFGDRATFRRADLRDPGWTSRVGGSFDAVVSCYAIHNVRDPDVIERVYHDVFPLVRRNGCFLNLDLVHPLDEEHVERQIGWLRDAGFQEVDATWADMPHVLFRSVRTA